MTRLRARDVTSDVAAARAANAALVHVGDEAPLGVLTEKSAGKNHGNLSYP